MVHICDFVIWAIGRFWFRVLEDSWEQLIERGGACRLLACPFKRIEESARVTRSSVANKEAKHEQARRGGSLEASSLVYSSVEIPRSCVQAGALGYPAAACTSTVDHKLCRQGRHRLLVAEGIEVFLETSDIVQGNLTFLRCNRFPGWSTV